MKRSLLLRFGVAITVIFILAVSGMLSSVIIAETAQGFAAAINQAGTLRMQSYRIASSLRLYGMPIMKERAEWLGGSIHIAESSSGGTQVRLTFTLTGGDHYNSHEPMLQKLIDD